MGLGKTIEALVIDFKLRKATFKKGIPRRKTLIVAPLSVHEHWERHIRMIWPTAKIYTIDRKNRPAFVAALKRDYNFFIVHYEGTRLRDLQPALRKVAWFHIICDEVHRIKSRKAQQTRAIKSLNSQYRFGLSGTPADNKPQDLWSILNWLYPKRYSSYWRFVNEYCRFETMCRECGGKSLTEGGPAIHVKNCSKIGQQFKKIVGVKEETIPYLLKEMEPFYIRRLKTDVRKDLPGKYYTEHFCSLTPRQRKAYNQMRKHMLAWVGEHEDQELSAAVIVAQLIRLQQFALASASIEYKQKFKWTEQWNNKTSRTEKVKESVTVPVLLLEDPSAKLDALEEMVDDNPQEQFVLFCVDEKTEIITDRGWLRYDQVKIGDRTLSISPATGLSEWDTVLDLNIYRGTTPVVHVESKRAGLSAVTTPSHRWLTFHKQWAAGGNWRWRTTDTLTHFDRVPKAAPCSTLPKEPKYSDAFVELVAWLWTEGSVPNSSGLNIHQSNEKNPEAVARIRAALFNLCPNPIKSNVTNYQACPFWTERTEPKQDDFVKQANGSLKARRANSQSVFYIGATLARELKRVFLKHKVVDPQFIVSLTKAQLELFTQISWRGDGCERSKSLLQENEEQLFAIQLALTLLGIPTATTWSHASGYPNLVRHTGLWYRPGDKNYLHERATTSIVWCPTTQNGTWLARRRGRVYFTGNSQFVPMVELAARRLEAKGISVARYTGRITQDERNASLKAFQQGNIQVFAGTIAAGGESIDLTASSTVCFFDRHWNPSKNQQAEDRCNRPGQTKPVQVIDYMARDTVDLGRKQQIAQKWSQLKLLLGDKVDPDAYIEAGGTSGSH
jgi:hypothetical protein